MTTKYARQAIARGLAKGWYEPRVPYRPMNTDAHFTNDINNKRVYDRKDDAEEEERAMIRASFRVLYSTPLKNTIRSPEEVAAMPLQLSTVGEIPHQRTDSMYNCKEYRPDNSRHRRKFKDRESVRHFFADVAYEE